MAMQRRPGVETPGYYRVVPLGRRTICRGWIGLHLLVLGLLLQNSFGRRKVEIMNRKQHKNIPFAASVLIFALLLSGLRNGNAQSQSEQVTNASPPTIKAYKTLNFGDNTDTVDHKLAEILSVSENETSGEPDIYHSELFWRSLFDTDAEYEPYKYDATLTSQSDKLESLMNYFRPFRVTVHSEDNSAISLNCYELYDTVEKGGCLAVVEVSYKTFDSNKLSEAFLQNYPNARTENKSYKFESTMYPGIFIEFERAFFSDVNQDRRATLSIPTDKFTFDFTAPSKLSADQLAAWNTLMTQNDKTNMDEYFESVKTSLLELANNIESDNAHSLDPLTYQGWYYNGQYQNIIYGAPNAVFASKQILDPLINNYSQSIETADQAEKAKLKKDSDSSSGF